MNGSPEETSYWPSDPTKRENVQSFVLQLECSSMVLYTYVKVEPIRLITKNWFCLRSVTLSRLRTTV